MLIGGVFRSAGGLTARYRTAAMIVALKRIEAHYLIEGFSQ